MKAGNLSLPFPGATTPTSQEAPSARDTLGHLEQRGILWYCQLRAGTATTVPHPRGWGQEGCGWTGPWALRGREVTGKAWGPGRGVGRRWPEPLPWSLLLFSLDVSYKHNFKDKTIENLAR